MSTSILYHAFGVTTYHYLKTVYEPGAIVFHLGKKPAHQRCVACRSRNVSRQSKRIYRVKTIPIGLKLVYLMLHLYKLKCKDCNAYRQESRDITLPRKTYTRQLARLVLDLARRMTLLDVARFLKMDWHLIKEIVKSKLTKDEKARCWKAVRYIAIDEFAVRKGHHYMTVVVDLESGMVLDVVEGRDAKCLKPVFTRLRRKKAQIQAITMDMSPAFRKAVALYAPGVPIVHDPFHIVKAMNEVVDEVRRQEQNRLESEGRNVIKGNRFLLLKGKEKLVDDPEKQTRLQRMLEMNANLQAVYLLKEDLRQIWSQGTKERARAFLEQWIENAHGLKLRPVTRLVKTLKSRQDEILAWYDFHITTGPLEGLNNKIKVLKRRAYGYRDLNFFRLLILFIHNKSFQLAGT